MVNVRVMNQERNMSMSVPVGIVELIVRVCMCVVGRWWSLSRSRSLSPSLKMSETELCSVSL